MTNHPNRGKKPGNDLLYIDGQMQRIAYIDKRSMAGYGPGPEYKIAYQLSDGRWMRGVRHTDRGNLMTDVSYMSTPGIR